MASSTGGAAEALERARRARNAGRYAEVLVILEGCENWPAPLNELALLQRANAIVHTSPVDALGLLAKTHDLFQTDDGKFGYYVTSARAYVRTRNYDVAGSMLELAAGLADSVDETSRCLLWHQRAVLRWCEERFAVDDDDIASLLGSNDPNGRFLGLVMRGWMRAGLGDLKGHARDLGDALSVAFAHPGSCDLSLVAMAAHALLRLGLEMGDEEAIAAGTQAFETIDWPEDLHAERFLCVRALAWSAFLRGDSAHAQWLFKDSKDLAGSKAWKVMAHVDRAFVARMAGNEPWAHEEMVLAHSLARGVDWGATRGEERQALVMLAGLFAPSDMSRAQEYVSIYLQMGREGINPSSTQSPNDPRPIAFEKYAIGRVQQVLGNRDAAVAAYRRAETIFAQSGYHFRAALAALGLFETTGETNWLERAREHAAAYPRSALAKSLAHDPGPADTVLRDLTPMQRQVAFALNEGLDMAALSQRFSRSSFTMERLVNAVYERFAVKNRHELRAAFRRAETL